MKRNLISWFKFLILAALTVFFTTLIFRLIHGPRALEVAKVLSTKPTLEAIAIVKNSDDDNALERIQLPLAELVCSVFFLIISILLADTYYMN